MIIVLDVECTGAQRDKAAPFNFDNQMCCVGIRDVESHASSIYKIEYDDSPYGEALNELKTVVEKASTLVTFNGKYDLHWIRRYGVDFRNLRIFDCQLAYFILTGQRNKYPSLDEVAEWCGVEKKYDVVKTEYWDKGLDTDDVPWAILSEYLEQDLNVTEQVYHKLVERINNSPQRRVFQIACHDLKVLEEMEWNGFKCNKEKSLRKGDELVLKLKEIDDQLRKVFNCDWFNPDSGDQLSVMLYGGTIELDGTEDYVFTYKDGRTAVKTRKVKVPYSRQGILTPLPRSQLAKEGFYSTDKATLIKLQDRASKEARQILDLLLTRSKLEKRRGTYYHGLPKLLDKMNWKDDVIHGNLNQCVVVTGRLSADKPNLQNVEEEVKEVFVSRFPLRRKQ